MRNIHYYQNEQPFAGLIAPATTKLLAYHILFVLDLFSCAETMHSNKPVQNFFGKKKYK